MKIVNLILNGLRRTLRGQNRMSPIFILFADKEGITFEVPSSSSDEKYMVTWDFDNGWLCDCKGCLLGNHLCKHIMACMDFMKFVSMAVLDDPQVYVGGEPVG